MPESEILAFRIAQLEQEHKALREELHTDYLDRHQAMNEFVPRAEQQRHAAVRREWPVIVFAGLMWVTDLAVLVMQLRGGR